ncbi:TPA: 4-hydroxy-tetrahydrodipicolinate synthase [Candidatus Sumerlaeota bacterium]|jgi:4-hydroxy-tetrahydrodipicolinate synthase|nr:4-hydroxy-tetrahydrodipicolinate synthase [Candidatus Sumerlaeota bacterium]
MFQGSITAIITPFKNGKFDKDAFANLIEYQIANGTTAIVPCGTTGESATMSHAEHHEVIAFAVEQVRHRIQVIAGTGSNSTSEALDLTIAARDLGADAALLISPYYNKPMQEGIYLHYTTIAQQSKIPLVVYNCPGRTGSTISPDTVARLSEVPGIVAYKDAVGSIDHTSEVISKCGITVLSGNDSMNLPIIAVGGKGSISVLANFAPRANADLCNAALEGRWCEALELHKKYFNLSQTLFIESNPIMVKAACEMMGLCGGEIRMPLTPAADTNRAKLRASMQAVGLVQ